jgi:hypothetical protein
VLPAESDIHVPQKIPHNLQQTAPPPKIQSSQNKQNGEIVLNDETSFFFTLHPPAEHELDKLLN